MRQQHVGTVKDGARGLLHPLWLHVMDNSSDVEPYLDAIVTCYKDVFAGPPYNEDYTGKEETYIKPSFRRFAEHGVLVLLTTDPSPTDGIVVGFGGSEPASLCEDHEFLAANTDRLAAPPERYLYMAELGVLAAFRQQGLGAQLVTERMNEARTNPRFMFTHVIMRTAKDGSNSKRIYEHLGAQVIDGLLLSKDDFQTAANLRIFMSMPLR